MLLRDHAPENVGIKVHVFKFAMTDGTFRTEAVWKKKSTVKKFASVMTISNLISNIRLRLNSLFRPV